MGTCIYIPICTATAQVVPTQNIACMHVFSVWHTYICSAVCLLADDDSGVTRKAVVCAFDNYPLLGTRNYCAYVKLIMWGRETLKSGN